VLTAEQVRAVFAAVPLDDPFRDLLTALRETGCRTCEVYGLTADRVDLAAGTWRVRDKVARTTGEPFRTVYLSGPALRLSRRILSRRKSGHVFVNQNGKPWTRNSVALRFALVDLGYS
jgi:integrase